MNALTGSSSISFDPSALADWAADFYMLDRLAAGRLDIHTPGAYAHSRRVARLAASTATTPTAYRRSFRPPQRVLVGS